MLSTTYYIKIFPNRIVAKNLDSGAIAEAIPESPYQHPRLLIGSISSAEFALVHALAQVKSRNPLKTVRLLIHPIAEFPGGVSEAEERLFRQLAFDARAASVVLWFGPELTDQQVNDRFNESK